MKSLINNIKIFFLPCKENNYRATITGNKFLVSYLLFLIFLKISFVSFLVCFPKTDFFADVSKAFLFELTNEDREELSLNSLKRSELLDRAARLKAEDMLENDYFSHVSPSGVTPWYWIDKVGYQYESAGENLGIGFLDSEEIYQAWYDSVLHQKNLLNAKYEEMGIAVLRGEFQGNNTTVVVQLFGSRKKTDSPVEVANADISEEEISSPEEEGIGEETEKEVLSETEEKVIPEGYLSENGGGSLTGLSGFMVEKYDDMVRKIILYSLSLIVFLLIINLIVKFDIEHRDLIFKAAGFSAILIAFGFLNKELIIESIPHALLLNVF